jgi:hypothetical protein
MHAHVCAGRRIICALTVLSVLVTTAATAQENSGPDIKVGGYVKLDYLHDFDYIGNASQFKTNSIPVDGSTAADRSGQTNLQARETRLTLTMLDDTPRGAFKAYVEGDFYGDNNSFRLRHAYGELGEVLGGQTWTTFMDISARPRSLDYEGPDSEIFVRQAMIRWTRPLSQRVKFAIAIEQPGSQFAIPDTLTGVSSSELVDLPASLRFEGDRGHVQVAGIVRQIRFDGEAGSSDVTTMGYGGNVSFRVRTSGKDALMGEVAVGQGIGRYIECFNGEGADAVFTSIDEMDALNSAAAVLAYERHWTDTMLSSFAVSAAVLEENDRLAPGVIKQCTDARVNLIWAAWTKVDIGGEVLWGERENQNGASGDAVRFQFSLIYKLI